MPRASKYRFSEKEFEKIYSHLLYTISSINSSGDVEKFLDGFLSKEEKIMLAKRLVLFMMLKRNYPPSVIQRALHISYETVRINQNQLSSKNLYFQTLLNRLIRREQTKELFEKLDKAFKPLALALESKTNMKSRAKFISGDWH